jgi:hypothetical protein
MRTLEPRRWWFALPVPIALLIALIIKSALLQVNSLYQMYYISCVGGISFPIGLFAPFDPGVVMILWGWVLYASLTIAGFIKPRSSVFWILCALLVLNIGGYQLL